MKASLFASLAVILATGILASCNKSDTASRLEQVADSIRKANESMAHNSGGGTEGSGGSAQHHTPVPAVDYHKLQGFLPQISGYTMGKPSGSSLSMNEWSYSTAACEYSQADSRVTVTIWDYAFIESLIAAYKTHFSFENEDGYTKSIEVSGCPGWETWTKNDRTASSIALVGDRYVVVIEGRDVTDASVTRNVLSSMNLSGIAGLK